MQNGDDSELLLETLINMASNQKRMKAMFTVLADAMFAATLARRGQQIPDRFKDGHHNRRAEAKQREAAMYKNLW